ncbi:MAG: GIY-YIG nuclease family protein [Planctomycetota bacterium]
MTGNIYILINQAMPGLIKIGKTQGAVEDRLRSLDTTGTPLPFECFYAAEVARPDEVERALHEAFEDHRVRKNREFFRISPDKPRVILELLQLKNVTPGRDVVSEPDDQRALDEARERRSHFRFSMIDLPAGTILHSVLDESITCEVADDRRIRFRGDEHSLSSAALIVAREKGYQWKTIAGPQYWKFDGRTLSELRQEKLEGIEG